MRVWMGGLRTYLLAVGAVGLAGAVLAGSWRQTCLSVDP